MSGQGYDDNLAYGEDYRNTARGTDSEADRGLVGDAFRKLKTKYQQSSYGQTSQSYPSGQPNYGYGQAQPPSSGAPYGYGGQGPSHQQTQSSDTGQGPPNEQNQSSYTGQGPSYQQNRPGYGGTQQQQRPDLVSKIFSGLQSTVQSIGGDVAGLLGTQYQSQQYNQQSQPGSYGHGTQGARFGSFASEKVGNDVKWYVDGAGYFWAVSKALEGAKESIWILDWWLSPELYLRRPPSKNEQYRLDRMLQRAAERGVRVNVIVYKEVTQALTRKYISPIVPKHIHSLLPRSVDNFTSALIALGLRATTASLEYAEASNPLIEPFVTVSSSHTKHALESLHPNIAVFRHPDHLPDAKTAESSLISSLQGLRLDAAGASKLGADALKALYGFDPENATVLYWAHHEKLLIVDSNLAFMDYRGGLDLCFGRWDLNQHPIADAHGEDLQNIIWPGQDYNNNRIMDFQDVAQPFQNKLDRTRSSRMGWSDTSISLKGPVVSDLRYHFVNRWNFIFDEKYNRVDPRYTQLSMTGRPTGPSQVASYPGSSPQPVIQPPQTYGSSTPQFPPPPGSQASQQPAWQGTSRPHTPDPSLHTPQQPQQGSNSPYQSYRPPSSQSSTQQPAYYPPPPPGPPPAASTYQQDYNHPQPGNAQTSVDHSYDPQTLQIPSNVAELPSISHDQQAYPQAQNFSPPPTGTSRGFDDQAGVSYDTERGFGENPDYGNERGFGGRFDKYRQEGRRLGNELSSFGNMVGGQLENRVQSVQGSLLGGTDQYGRPLSQPRPVISCQVVRSCTKWSNGTHTEHSIQDAYIQTILSAQHFIYIENQFFITATGDHQHPVKNQIGKALLERILRAARAGQPFKVIVNIPSVPGFAGDLRDDSSLGTRAIMNFQYNSINRGGHSIMEGIAREGYNPMDYIRFYNLRNYDRINVDNVMKQAERQSGVPYEAARKQHDDFVGAGYGNEGERTGAYPEQQGSQYQRYQAAAQQVSPNAAGRWDSVSECYMLNGPDIRTVPWNGPAEAEIDAFVSEELYIHTKVMIVDDRVVICGSANLNDRSQLGTHDSEIALVVSDPTPVQSSMGGRPWQASRFAASLRRQLFRKHLGLIRPQDPQRPDANFDLVGVPNAYDWGSPEDNIVSDPLSPAFQSLWNSRARTNTEVFRKVFHTVPDDSVNTWTAYREFFEYYFHKAGADAQGKDGNQPPARYEWGHVVREDFPGGVQEVKELLSQVKGTLVEMPLTFLQHEDIAQEGITLNPLTEPVYT